jgi:hypothetical protein
VTPVPTLQYSISVLGSPQPSRKLAPPRPPLLTTKRQARETNCDGVAKWAQRRPVALTPEPSLTDNNETNPTTPTKPKPKRESNPESKTKKRRSNKNKNKTTAAKKHCPNDTTSNHQTKSISGRPVQTTFIGVIREFLWHEGKLTPERLIQRPCFQAWLNSRATQLVSPIKTYQRALTAQLGGKEGRAPFTREEETAILAFLRAQEGEWPCSPKGSGVGRYGFRARGYHEGDANE